MFEFRIGIIFIVCMFLMSNILGVSSQEVSAKIVNVEYPSQIVEGRLFNLTVTVRNLANTSEIFAVKIIRGNLFSKQKEISIETNASGQANFELKLLLTGSLRIEVWHGNQLMDSTDIHIFVPSPEVDVGLLMMQMIEVEITAVGVTLAGLAIFATLYIRMKQSWASAKIESLSMLEKSERKSDKEAKKILQTSAFLIKEDYNDCLEYFVQSNSVKKVLSKAVNIEKMKELRSNLENVKKSNVHVIFVLLIAIVFGIVFVLSTPTIIDIVWFINPTSSERDIILFTYYVPLFFILMLGIEFLIYRNYTEELGKLAFLPMALYFAVVLLWIATARLIALLALGFGFATGLVISYIERARARRRRKIVFRKEMGEIKRLKDNQQKLHEKSLAKFGEEKTI